MSKFISVRGVAGFIFSILAFFAAVVASAEEPPWSVVMLHSFGNAEHSANRASYGLVLAHDGKLYGTTFSGGAHAGGTVFRINRDGRQFEILHDFASQPGSADGVGPAGNVMEASDGKLYGATIGGGTNAGGTIYRLDADGSDFEVIHSFRTSDHSDGEKPQDKLIEGPDGKLYGVTQYGGKFESGAVYRINKDGSDFELLHDFDWNSDTGYWPKSALLWGSDGVLYGTLAEGEEVGDLGKIFKINPDGGGYEIIHDFSADTNGGGNPIWGLIEGPDGALYGSTPLGGPLKDGVIFKIRKNGRGYQVVQSFAQVKFTLGEPSGPMAVSPDGTIYGVTRYGGRPQDGGTVYSLGRTATELRVVGYLGKSAKDVASPSGELAMDDVGNFYGSSITGGPSNEGALFRMDLAGNHVVLRTFNSTGGDGGRPVSPLALGADGSLYGTTARGGEFGKGTIFRVKADGSEYQIVRSLNEVPSGVIGDSASSNLFFTTATQLFRLKANGALKILHVFRNSHKDGTAPGVPLEGSDGVLYGTTTAGGSAGYGTIYRVKKNGSGYHVLFHLPAPSGTNIFEVPTHLGEYLLEGSDGALYGTTSDSFRTLGKVFKINKDGTGFSILRTFKENDPAGPHPAGPLMEGSDGLLYGTTDNSYPCVVYAMNKDGSGFKIIYTFVSSGVFTGLMEGVDGALYGMASSNNGALFRLTKAGDAFRVLGNVGPSDSEANFVRLPDGSFCGTTTRSGDMDLGQVFRLRLTSVVVTLP